MTPEDALKSQLAGQIAARDAQGAKSLARRMSPGLVGSVLEDLAGHEKASVRLLVLDIASEIASDGACRAILSRLQDANLTVRSVANNLTGGCAHRSVVPDLFTALEQDLDFRVKGALVRQIGLVGDKRELTRLRASARKVREPELLGDFTAAMARLGDQASRAGIIRRLGDAGAEARVAALHDIEYIGDSRSASHFRPVLEDRRDVMVISLPHDPPVMARVCDVAAGSLGILGLPLSFHALPLRRLTETEIGEALHLVTSMQAGH